MFPESVGVVAKYGGEWVVPQNNEQRTNTRNLPIWYQPEALIHTVQHTPLGDLVPKAPTPHLHQDDRLSSCRQRKQTPKSKNQYKIL